MEKYHINSKTLEPGKCSATRGNCPFGGDDEHFTSLEAARSRSEKPLQALNGWVSQSSNKKRQFHQLIDDIQQLEADPALSRYDRPEDEHLRFVLKNLVKTKRQELSEIIPHGEFYYLTQVIYAQDRAEALSSLLSRLPVAHPERDWNSVMGSNTRKTKASVAAWTDLNKQFVKGNIHFEARVEASAKKLRDSRIFSRAHHEGVVLPAHYEREFEAIWNDPNTATGETKLVAAVQALEKLKHDYSRGTISPVKIVGNGMSNPDSAVKEYFKNRTERLGKELASRGRGNEANVNTVIRKAKEQGWEFAPFTDSNTQ